MIDPMAGKFRALMVALVVLIVALVGALSLGLRNIEERAQHAPLTVSVNEAGVAARDASDGSVAPAELFEKELAALEAE